MRNRVSKIADSLGLTPEERDELILFCLSDEYPRRYIIKRTATTYTLSTPQGAALLLNKLRFGNKSLAAHVTLTEKGAEFFKEPAPIKPTNPYWA